MNSIHKPKYLSKENPRTVFLTRDTPTTNKNKSIHPTQITQYIIKLQAPDNTHLPTHALKRRLRLDLRHQTVFAFFYRNKRAHAFIQHVI